MGAVLAIPFWVELLATFTGAVSGSIHAVKHGYDLFGTACIACVTGLSGGILRDVLLQDFGIYAFQRPELIVTAVFTAVFVFFFCKAFEKLDLVMDVIDSVSVALYAVIGAGKALSAGLSIIPATIMGTLTAVGGGCVRDILLARPPKIFQCGSPYAIAATAGALVYAIMRFYGFFEAYSPFVGVAIVLVLRFSSMFFGIETQPARDYTDSVVRRLVRLKAWFVRHLPRRKG